MNQPLLRWRMLRHGYFRYPVHVEHCTINDVRRIGLKIRAQQVTNANSLISKSKVLGSGKTQTVTQTLCCITSTVSSETDRRLRCTNADVARGGGFALGSSYFYLEFLLTWHHLLKERGFKNPAIFAIDYTLAPDDTYPTQVLETLQGYRHVIKVAKDTSKVCVGGDSAGGALTLSLLLELAAQGGKLQMRPGRESHPIKLALPHMAILISPWVTLVSSLHQDSDVDYLDRERLWEYAHEYVGKAKVNVSPASPGSCTDESLWRLCQPKAGYFVVYSGVEMLAEDARNFVKQQRKYGADVQELDYDGGVHAWPVVCMTTASTRERRLRGVKAMAEAIRASF
mgnify:CR=1 FL=1